MKFFFFFSTDFSLDQAHATHISNSDDMKFPEKLSWIHATIYENHEGRDSVTKKKASVKKNNNGGLKAKESVREKGPQRGSPLPHEEICKA